MSDQKPPFPSKNKTPQEAPSSFNWGFYILLALIIGVLSFSFFGDGSFYSSKKLTLREFESAYKEGKIIVNDVAKAPLRVLTTDGTTEAHIKGFMLDPKSKLPSGITEKRYPFVCDFNTSILDEKLKSRLVSLGMTVNPASQLPADSEAQKLSLDEVSKLIGLAAIPVSTETPLNLSIEGDRAVLSGSFITRTFPPVDNKDFAPRVGFEVPFNTSFDKDKVRDLLEGVAEFKTTEESFFRLFLQFLPILIIIALIFFLFRSQMRSMGKNAQLFGKSRAKELDASRQKRVTFKDVAGVTEAKEEVWEIVDFLREPEKFQALGATIPKGILMIGSPGTGKTLIARAIAGEAEVPFYTISGSDFVEMFVGVGASRVRDMFDQAKKNAPCLIFIDEIDAVGRHRGHGVGGGHDEREQTLNALLVEMDGFEGKESVIVIAATNRPDVLDPALLRPGRFDRQVVVNLPDVKGREEILQVHAKKVKMAENVDLAVIARGTAGFSGAKLANLINEATLLAVRRGKNEVTQSELEEARDKEGWGKERRSMAISEKGKRVTAYHEAGHALCLIKSKHTDPLHKVTIIPRGPSLGSTMWLPAEDKFTAQYNELLDTIVVAMGGRCAEEIIFQDVTSGATGDIHMVTSIARRMVCEYGMSSALGLVEYGESQKEVFLARDMGHSRNYSEATAQLIDQEIRRITDEGYARCKSILLENKDQLILIAEALLIHETLDGAQIHQLLEEGSLAVLQNEDMPPPLPTSTEIAPSLDPEQSDIFSPSEDPAPLTPLSPEDTEEKPNSSKEESSSSNSPS